MKIGRHVLVYSLLAATNIVLPAQADVEVLWQYSASGASVRDYFTTYDDDSQYSDGPFGGFSAGHQATHSDAVYDASATFSGQVLANRSANHVRLAGEMAATVEVSTKVSSTSVIIGGAGMQFQMRLLISDEPMLLIVSNYSTVVSDVGPNTDTFAGVELTYGPESGSWVTIPLGMASMTNQFSVPLGPGTFHVSVRAYVELEESFSAVGSSAQISYASQWGLLVAPPDSPAPSTDPAITTEPPPDGTLGDPYSFLMAATGDPLPSFLVITGALPPGLSLSAEGFLDGTPTATGTFSFAVQAWNGSPQADTKDYEIIIRRAPFVFIHGVAGSVLKAGSDYIWPTIDPANVAKLHLVDGATNAVAVDAVREYDVGGLGVEILPFYGQFIRNTTQAFGYVEFDLAEDRSRLTNFYLVNQSFPEPPNLFVYPYDWRKPNAEHTAALHTFIQRIRAVNDDRKVNLVVHSMGGLVMRRYLLDYGTGDIGRIVTVGSPIWGAPESAFRMFTGIFFGLGPIDFINSTAMKKSVLSMPAVHELNPSDKYLQHWGFPVFTEIGTDYNNNGIANEGYSSAEFRVALDEEAHPQTPATNNIAFHGHLGGRQGDWSQDSGAIPFLHIIGKQAVDATTVGIEVKAKTFITPFDFISGPRVLQAFSTVKGEGDGTVPTLSSQRLPQYYAPGTIVREINEPLANVPSAQQPAGQAAEHTMLMFNTSVWSMIHAFLDNRTVPTQSSIGKGGRADKPVRLSQSAPPLRRVLVMGCSPVHIRNDSGQSNTFFSAAVAQRIPGVEVIYDNEQEWVLIEFAADSDLVIESTPGCDRVEIEAIDLASDGSPTALRRFRIDAGTHRWQLVLDVGSPASLAIDADDSGIFDPSEVVAPTHTADGAGTDIEPPNVSLTIAYQGSNMLVEADAHDVDSSPVVLRYSLDGGPPQTYTGAMTFATGSTSELAFYAEDALGNASGLIRTRLQPELSATRGTGSSLVIEWPIADGYRLESAPTVNGPWTPQVATTLRRAAYRQALVPLEATTMVYRLAFQPILLAAMPNRPPELALMHPTNGATFLPGSEIIAEASVADPDGDAVALTWFLRNAASNLVATSTNNPATFILATAGTYTLEATATDTNGASSTSPSITIHAQVPLTAEPGAIAFTGLNALGDDHLAFVALAPIPGGANIYFSDNEWNGLPIGSGGAFNDSGECEIRWTAPPEGVPAGTVVLLNAIELSAPLTASTGSVAYWDNCLNSGIGSSSEAVFAYMGEFHAPEVFLAAIGKGTFSSAFGSLNGTGLVLGETALHLPGTIHIMAYNGARSGSAGFAVYLPLINSTTNWITEAGVNVHTNGIPPDVPFDTTLFTITP